MNMKISEKEDRKWVWREGASEAKSMTVDRYHEIGESCDSPTCKPWYYSHLCNTINNNKINSNNNNKYLNNIYVPNTVLNINMY